MEFTLEMAQGVVPLPSGVLCLLDCDRVKPSAISSLQDADLLFFLEGVELSVGDSIDAASPLTPPEAQPPTTGGDDA